MTPGNFLCGCSPEQKKNYCYNMSGEILTSKRYDDAGYEVCPEHGARIYGWNSPQVQHASGHYVPDWANAGSSKPLKLRTDTVDKRDNRDPLEMAREREARINGT